MRTSVTGNRNRAIVSPRCSRAGSRSAGQRRARRGQGARVVPGDQLVAALRGEPLELPDLGRALLQGYADEAAGYLVLAATGRVGGVEGEHEPAAAREVDDEALVAGRVPGGQHGGDAGRQLGVAGGEAPVDG